MPVGYILARAGSKVGLNPNDASQRGVLLNYLNEAADELYSQADMAGSLIEQAFQVNGDQTIALPSYVGELRAVRELNSHIAWHLNQMRPRYNISNWRDMWRNWRIKGHKALMREITNQSKMKVTVHGVETPNVVVTIKGQTPNASSVTEVVTLNATSVLTTNSFYDISLVVKDRVNNFDVSITDIDDVVMTVIPNDMLEANYMIVDISTLPWLDTATSSQDHYVEVLYKKALSWLHNDGDEFPAKGYDNIIVNKMMQLLAEDQDKAEKAVTFDAKATRSLARKHENENRATEDSVAFVTNPHDELLTRIRVNRPGRQHASVYPYGVS